MEDLYSFISYKLTSLKCSNIKHTKQLIIKRDKDNPSIPYISNFCCLEFEKEVKDKVSELGEEYNIRNMGDIANIVNKE